MEIGKKLNSLRDYMNGKNVLVAFSGGADSTLLALIANDESKESLAVTVDNGVMPSDCIQKAEEIAKKIGIKHLIIRRNFLDDSGFSKNQQNRCYICKNKIYGNLVKLAADNQYEGVVDGTNISDLMEDRPGIMVNIEKNIKMPLVKSGFTSDEVRKILHDWGVHYNPSTTCFATRIPTGSSITSKKISRIAYAENLIHNLTGLDVVRVRDNEGFALIQVKGVGKIIDKGLLNIIDSELKAVGFNKVTLDIANYVDSKNQMMIYKPCKDEKNKIMFETELPYHLNIPETCHELNTWGEVKFSEEMGIVMLEMDNSNITLFAKGKIVARKVKDQKEAQELLVKILPFIRRQN